MMIDDDLRIMVIDGMGCDLTDSSLSDVKLMLQRHDEDALLEFFTDLLEGGLTRDHCISLSNLMADYAEL